MSTAASGPGGTGFHAEHRSEDLNEAEIKRLLAVEARWRPTLGPEAEAG